MKKNVSLALALILSLVLILALAGCTASNRAYRRATDPNRYPGTYDGTYRTNLRPRTINPADAPRLDGTQNRLSPRTPGGAAVPSPTTPILPSPAPGVTPNQPNRMNKSFNVAS